MVYEGCKFMTESIVNANKEKMLLERMVKLGIRDSDLREAFIRGSGRGGQKINKTSSCVQLLHLPTGIQVKCQQTRSRALNRFLARRELCEKIADRVYGEQSARQQEIEKSAARNAAAAVVSARESWRQNICTRSKNSLAIRRI